MKEERVFRDLLFLDTKRGPHSTGILKVQRRDGEATIKKELGTPWDFWGTKGASDFLDGNNKLLMGHNRWATTGAVNRENAHPFHKGHIYGAHNGTLRNQSLLDDHELFEVDSENIFHQIFKRGVEDTVSKLHGAYSLVWYNKDTEELAFLKNYERPLFYAWGKSGNNFFWASESWMLTQAAAFSGYDIGEVMPFKDDTYYRIKVGAGMIPAKLNPKILTMSGRVLGSITSKAVNPYVPPVVVYKNYNNWGGQGGYGHRRGWSQSDWADYYDDLYGKEEEGGGSIYNRSKKSSTKAREVETKHLDQALKYLEVMIGQPVYMAVAGSSSYRSADYIQAFTTSSNDLIEQGVECRIFSKKGTPQFCSYNICGQYLKGTVKRVTQMGKDHYLLIDNRTVMIVDEIPKPIDIEEEGRLYLERLKGVGYLLAKSIGEEVESPKDLLTGDSDGVIRIIGDPDDGVVEAPDGYIFVGDGRMVKEEEFDRLVKGGCAVCSDPIEIKEAHMGEIAWRYDDRPMHLECLLDLGTEVPF